MSEDRQQSDNFQQGLGCGLVLGMILTFFSYFLVKLAKFVETYIERGP